MPKVSGWWSIAQTAMVGGVVVFVAYSAGKSGNVWALVAASLVNALIYGLGELLNQSSADLREHSLALLRQTDKEARP